MKKNSFWNRIAADAALIIAVCVTPWWFALVTIGMLSFITPKFVEGVLAGFFIDIVYGGAAGNFHFYFTLIAILILVISETVKRRLLFYTPA